MTEPFNPMYYNTVDQIFHAPWTATKLSRLARLRQAVQTLWPHGHPTRLVHVAGTNGKGSTCRFLERGLALFGKAGSFMGPHLFDYRERFSIDSAPPAQSDVTAAWEQVVRPLCIEHALSHPQQPFSFHEVNILMALALFDQHNVAWAAIETGMGGRYDQTSALDVVATMLTNVGDDHEHLLGREQWQRALDKAGIARPGVPLFTSERDPATQEVIAAVCAHVQAPLHLVDPAQVEQVQHWLAASEASVPADALVRSEHQQWNAALSLAVIRHLVPDADTPQVLAQFRTARLLGRFWQVAPDVYADVAHNPGKIAALVREIAQKFGDHGKIFVVGVAGQRSPVALLAPLAEVAKAIVVTGGSATGIGFFKGQSAQEVKQALDAVGTQVPTFVVAEPQQALAAARSLQDERDIIVLTGSTYMIDQVLNPDPYLRYLNATYGWRMPS